LGNPSLNLNSSFLECVGTQQLISFCGVGVRKSMYLQLSASIEEQLKPAMAVVFKDAYEAERCKCNSI
jgi:hypothetical protein